jgi:hypothetical protein
LKGEEIRARLLWAIRPSPPTGSTAPPGSHLPAQLLYTGAAGVNEIVDCMGFFSAS